MPFAKIEVRRHRSAVEVEAIMEAIYMAQRVALQVPQDDRQIRYIEHAPDHFAVPRGKSENYTYVEILIPSGRSSAVKRLLYKEIVTRLAVLGIHPKDVFIALQESTMYHWDIRGEPLAAETDLGFHVSV